MIFARSSLAPMVAAGFALLQLAGAGSALAAANCIKSEHKALFKIGWANIYSIPTWMKETTGTIEDMANVLKKQGLVDSLTIADAQGNANTQIQQIQSTIDAKLDAIMVDAGSAAALDRVIADACSKGIAVTNFDSLVDTKDLTTKNRHRSEPVGQACRGMARQAAERQRQHSRPERPRWRLGQRRSAQRR
jgi:ribose transport system substrate-binding protein